MMCSRLPAAFSAIVALTIAAGADAQPRDNRAPVPPPAPSVELGPPLAPEAGSPSLPHPATRLRDAVRFGGAFELAEGDSAENITVIGGNATIAGRVEHDVVVVLGDAHIGETAIINGSLTVVGGNARVTDGAFIRRDLAVVGGELEAPPGIVTRGDSFVLDTRAFGGRLRWVVDWCKRGLLWGRLFVPELGWMWVVIAAWLLLMLLAATLLESPARQVTAVLRARPISACAVGLGTLVLLGPLCVLLAVSVIGVLVVPFVLLTAVAAWVIGRVATARWIGSSFMSEGDEPAKITGLRSVVIGLAVIAVLYAFPVLGIAAWAGFGVFGLGGAMLTFINAYRRENPAAVPAAAAPGPASYAYGGPQEEGTVPMSTPIPLPLSSGAIPPERRGQGLIAFPHAMFLDRLAAAVLDLILILLINAFIDNDVRFNVMFLMTLAYHVGFITWKGTTIGGIILRLRVVRTDGTLVRGADALVRGLASVFSVVVLGLGFLWILRDPDRQAWHDRIAGTYVVKVPREWPI
jgi:uncharacterized RDD family membrane protein YckC